MGKTDSIQVPIFTGEPQDYEADFYGWSMEQSGRLRLLRVPGLDTENLAEEIESLGRSERQQLATRAEVLLMHLLKWKYQPEGRRKSCLGTIQGQRRKMRRLLKENPSLRPRIAEILADLYSDAVESAAEETGLPETSFPTTCEWSDEQVMTKDFLPD